MRRFLILAVNVQKLSLGLRDFTSHIFFVPGGPPTCMGGWLLDPQAGLCVWTTRIAYVMHSLGISVKNREGRSSPNEEPLVSVAVKDD